MIKSKFRVWDKKNKWMRQVVSIDFEGGTVFVRTPNIQTGHDVVVMLYFEEVELLQFTGLLDKNGKEIYEGDICKEFFNSKEDIGEVKFSPTQGYTVGGKSIWPHDIEVIGNIYQNYVDDKNQDNSGSGVMIKNFIH